MTNKAKKRHRAHVASTRTTYQGALNQKRRNGAEGELAALLCDVCGTRLITDRGDAMIQWCCEFEKPYGRVIALVFCHKGACDRVASDALHKLKLSSSWDDFATAFGAHPYSSEVAERLKRYDWHDSHRERLLGVERAVKASRAAGWRMPKPQGWEKAWDGPIKIGPLANRLAACFAEEPATFRAVQDALRKHAGKTFPSLEAMLVQLFVEAEVARRKLEDVQQVTRM